MTTERATHVAELLVDCTSRAEEPPTWDEVRAGCSQLRLGAAYLNHLAGAGLLTDELYLASVDRWPADIVAALQRLGLFETYSPTTLRGLLTHLDDDQIGGLVNTVKGTILEQEVVDRINSGDSLGLPGDPDRAELAASLTQPGWDIETFAGDEHAGYLQAKQTANWQPLAEHAERYPDLPVVATSSEALAAAAARGMDTTHLVAVTSDGAVTEHVGGVLDNLTASHTLHEVAPEVALGAIMVAGLLRLRAGHDREQTAKWVAEQAATAGAANLAGAAVQVVTGTVVLRPVAAMATRLAVERARVGHQTAEHVHELRKSLADLKPPEATYGT